MKCSCLSRNKPDLPLKFGLREDSAVTGPRKRPSRSNSSPYECMLQCKYQNEKKKQETILKLEGMIQSLAVGSERTDRCTNAATLAATLPSLGPLTRPDLEQSIARGSGLPAADRLGARGGRPVTNKLSPRLSA